MRMVNPAGDPTAAGLQFTIDGPIATLLLSRPEALNAQTPQLWRELRAVGATLPDSVRVVLVRGAGSSFSAGLDRAMFARDRSADELSLAAMAALPEAEALAAIADFQAAFDWLARPGIISIAGVQGHAVGAGFQLALACDLRVLTTDAQLTMAEVPLGLVPDLGGTKRLVELVGYSRAVDICVTGRRIDALEADRIGLASRVVAAVELDAAVDALAAAVLAVPAGAAAEVKQLLALAAENDHSDQQAAERAAQLHRLRSLSG